MRDLPGKQVEVMWTADAAKHGVREAAFLKAVAKSNRAIAERNARITGVLKQATGLYLGDQPTPWWDWWRQDYNGYDDRPPTKPVFNAYCGHVQYLVGSCFAPGIKVWTQPADK